MNEPLLLAVPRLHPEFSSSVPGCRTLWPGLSRPCGTAWTPVMPLPPSTADACIADYERACRDGAHGSPVQALGAEPAPADLSPEERKALREMAGLPAEEPADSMRLAAQQMLLLAWLQEAQASELAALEGRISASRSRLAGIIAGRACPEPEHAALPEEGGLPAWNKVLAAFLAFLPDMPEGTAWLVNSQAMAAELHGLPEPEHTPGGLPSGCTAKSATASELLALCPRGLSARLAAEPGMDPGRRITLILPAWN